MTPTKKIHKAASHKTAKPAQAGAAHHAAHHAQTDAHRDINDLPSAPQPVSKSLPPADEILRGTWGRAMSVRRQIFPR